MNQPTASVAGQRHNSRNGSQVCGDGAAVAGVVDRSKVSRKPCTQSLLFTGLNEGFALSGG